MSSVALHQEGELVAEARTNFCLEKDHAEPT